MASVNLSAPNLLPTLLPRVHYVRIVRTGGDLSVIGFNWASDRESQLSPNEIWTAAGLRMRPHRHRQQGGRLPDKRYISVTYLLTSDCGTSINVLKGEIAAAKQFLINEAIFEGETFALRM